MIEFDELTERLLNGSDSVIDKAITLATVAHEGQVRKYTNEPYIEHPKRVSWRVSMVPGASAEMIAAAVLHDTLEDTDLSPEQIERYCGPVVLRYVDGCTDKFGPEDHPGNRKVRKQLEAERLGKEPREVQVIKLADIFDNLVGTDPNDSFSEVFLREKVALMALMALISGADALLKAEVDAAGEKLRIAFDAAAAVKLAAKAAARAAKGPQ